MNSKTVKFNQIDISKFNGFLIDIDDTLYSYQKCHLHAIKKCYENFTNLKLFSMSFDEFNNSYRSARNIVTDQLAFQGSCRSRLLAFQIMFEKMLPNYDFKKYNHALSFEKLYWDELISCIEIYSGAYNFLESVFNQGKKICLVSDMQMGIQIKKINKLGIEKFISYLVTSEEVGEEKPSENIYKLALEKLGMSKDEVCMIGDNPDKDYHGANKFGISSFLISEEL